MFGTREWSQGYFGGVKWRKPLGVKLGKFISHRGAVSTRAGFHFLKNRLKNTRARFEESAFSWGQSLRKEQANADRNYRSQRTFGIAPPWWQSTCLLEATTPTCLNTSTSNKVQATIQTSLNTNTSNGPNLTQTHGLELLETAALSSLVVRMDLHTTNSSAVT